MRARLLRRVFVAMLREEWRMQTRLFGRVRYAAFPLVVLVLCAASVRGLLAVGVDRSGILAGMHGLALLFGIQTGLVGLVAGNAVGNRLNDVTLVLYSARTLPVSPVGLLSTYLVKDVVYYSGLFLVPFSAAVLPVASPGSVALLWSSTTTTFLLGGSITLSLVGAWRRGRSGRVGAVGALLAVAATSWTGVDPVAVTPYAWFRSPSLATFLSGTLPVAVLVPVGVRLYDVRDGASQRVTRSRLRSIARRVPGKNGELVAKTVLDLSRSSGGVPKVPFSAGVLAVAGLGMVALVERVVGTAPSYPVAMGAVLGLTAFTTYNWLTVFDDPGRYGTLPVEVGDLYRAKFHAFLVVGLPVGLATYLASLAVTGALAAGGAVGAVLVVCVQVYLFGLTVRLTGLSADEFLFDSVLFGAFSAAVAAVLVPALAAGLALGSAGTPALAGVLGWGIASGCLGLWLYRRAVAGATDRPDRSGDGTDRRDADCAGVDAPDGDGTGVDAPGGDGTGTDPAVGSPPAGSTDRA